MNVVPSKCINHDEIKYVDYSMLNNVGEMSKITIYCYDKYHNRLTEGGDSFEISISLQLDSGNIETSIEYNLIDNDNGSYDVYFVPPIEAIYVITIYLNSSGIYSIYDSREFNLADYKCDETKNEIKFQIKIYMWIKMKFINV